MVRLPPIKVDPDKPLNREQRRRLAKLDRKRQTKMVELTMRRNQIKREREEKKRLREEKEQKRAAKYQKPKGD